MKTIDFQTIQKICHFDAFGRDHRPLSQVELNSYRLPITSTDQYTLVWKIPFDVMHLATWRTDPANPIETWAVGTYSLACTIEPTTPPPSGDNHRILTTIQAGNATKLRHDARRVVERRIILSSIHELALGTTRLPGLSTSFFFNNFDAPQTKENQRLIGFLNTLSDLNLGAYYCRSQHMVVFGSHEGRQLTPQQFANLLATPAYGDRIKAALTEAAIPRHKAAVDQWAADYIRKFGGSRT